MRFHSIPVAPEPSFPADGYRFLAGNDNDIVCIIFAIPITTFAGIFEVIDGVEVSVVIATQQSDETGVTVKYTILGIQLDRHNRVFVCRATNRNGNEAVETTVQVFGKLNLLLLLHALHVASLKSYTVYTYIFVFPFRCSWSN